MSVQATESDVEIVVKTVYFIEFTAPAFQRWVPLRFDIDSRNESMQLANQFLDLNPTHKVRIRSRKTVTTISDVATLSMQRDVTLNGLQENT